MDKKKQAKKQQAKKTEKPKKKFRWQEPLIAFGITCALQALVIGLTIWYQSSVVTGINWVWDMKEMWIGNGIAFLIVFAIIYGFIKKPKEEEYPQK